MRSCLVVALALLFPIAGHAQDDSYYPLSKGRTWKYDAEVLTGVGGMGVKQKSTVTAKCGEARTLLGKKYYLMTFTDSRGVYSHTELVGYDNNGVIVTESTGRHMLLLPARFGKTTKPIKYKLKVGGAMVDVKGHKVGKPEKVKVPKGKFTAVPVSAVVKTTGGITIRTKVWYAKGVGPVKMVEEVDISGGVTNKITLVLREGKVPKKSTTTTTTDPVKTDPKTEVKGKASASKTIGAVVDAKGSGEHKSWKALETLFGSVGKTTKSLADRELPRKLTGLTKLVRGKDLTLDEGSEDQVVVVKGDLSALRLRKSVLIVDGDITVTSYVKGCVIICTGDVTISGYLKESVVVCVGDLGVAGYVKTCVVEAGDTTFGGYSKASVFINCSPGDLSTDDKKVKSKDGLMKLVKGK